VNISSHSIRRYESDSWRNKSASTASGKRVTLAKLPQRPFIEPSASEPQINVGSRRLERLGWKRERADARRIGKARGGGQGVAGPQRTAGHSGLPYRVLGWFRVYIENALW